MAIIEIEDLSHRFADGTPALDGINLSIAEQSLTVIAGCNGSGKTTLLKHINGLILPQSGAVTVAGIDVGRHPQKARRLVGMVFQDADSQIVGETVSADVAFGPENQKLTRAQIQRRVEGALAAVGLTHLADRHPHLLSGGEKRRLAIAGVLAMQPEIIMFDEPFANLDFPGMQQILQQMLALKISGHTLLVTTHELEKIFAIAQRVVVLRAGAVVADGPPGQINRQAAAYGVRPACSACRLEVPWPN